MKTDTIAERIEKLRCRMKARNIDIYLIPTADFHQSEYVGEYFKARQYMTGFTGSAGTAVITMDEAGLWTDGRYFLQAADQLKDTPVKLFKMGQENVPEVEEFISEKLPAGGCLGFDGRTVSAAEAELLNTVISRKNGRLAVEEDLVGMIWNERPPLSHEKARIRDLKFTGCDISEKLSSIRKTMKDRNCNYHLVSCLYDIAWILNVRGRDITYVPVVLSYLIIMPESGIWFVQEEALTEEVKEYLKEHNIACRPYEEAYDFVKTIPCGEKVWLDKNTVNSRLVSSLPADTVIYNAKNPSEYMRSIKNETEIAGARIAHEKDALAMIEFIYWIKQNIGKIPMTEISASDHLEALRRQQPGCLDLSFSTIAGYGAHGAIVHYKATEETDAKLKPEGLFLVDSGGHYEEGTTDITRTIVLGPITDEMKADFTRVCRSMLNLGDARFHYGCTGVNLDIIARAPLWEAGLDYNHGTGHGVGDVLNVHEGPQGIRWRNARGKNEAAAFEEGMITSDEPGYYPEGRYGIRIENELLCLKDKKTEFGQFMRFEHLTYVPIDLEAIDPEAMSEKERGLLNAYHAMVYEKMAPKLRPELKTWLKEATRAI